MIKTAIIWGVYCGLILGHFDLISRLISRNFEWFELYQALILPALVLPCIYLLLAPLLWFKNRADNSFTYKTLTFFISSFVIFTYLVQSCFSVEASLYQSPRLEITLLGTAVFVFLFHFLVRELSKKEISPSAQSFIRSVSRFWEQYCSLLGFVCISCWLTDVYMLQRTHVTKASKISDSSKPSSDTSKPNIVLISLDTVRADHLGIYGYELPTSPFLDSLASKSAVFDNAYSTSSWTLPAHASIFTGKYVSSHGAHMSHQKLEARETTLAEILTSQGYSTAGFIAGPYCKGKYGLSQGFLTYKDRLDFLENRHTKDHLSIRRLLRYLSPDLHDNILNTDGERTASELNTDIKSWLTANFQSPFFLFINYFDVHDPYNRGGKYQRLFTDQNMPYDKVHFFLDGLLRYRANYKPAPEIDQSMLDYTIALYDAEIRHLDSYLSQLIDLFKSHNIYENTLFIFVSDHGEEFLDHGSIFHEHTLYNELIKVPLVFHWPGHFKATRIQTIVSLTDILPTILEILNLPERSDIDGRSLLALMNGELNVDSRHHIAERFRRDEYHESGLTAVLADDWKLILSSPTKPIIPNSLFQLSSDPKEEQNLFESHHHRRELLSQKMFEEIGKPPAALLSESHSEERNHD